MSSWWKMNPFSHSPLDWLAQMSQSGLAEFAVFRIMNSWLSSRISEFGLDLMGRSMGWAAGIALTLVTLWILLKGYRIATGSSREPMMGLVVDSLRISLVIGAATTMGFQGTNLHEFLSNDLNREIHELVTGENGKTAADSIDRNLAFLQIAISSIDAIQIVNDDPELLQEKSNAKLLAGIGIAGPAIAAGVMLLLLKFVIAMWVGFGPIFIICLMFEQTKDMFKRWLQYGLGTLFSMAMLSFVTSLALDMMARVSATLWLAKLVNIPGLSPEGITSQAMQQGGMGMILTLLIVSVPPVAAHFFQGQIGSFMHFSAFGGSSSQQGPQGQAPGSYNPAQMARSQERQDLPTGAHSPLQNHGTRVNGDTRPTYSDSIKQLDKKE